MKYVEAPEEYPIGGDAVTVFLAGGITDCPNWQADMVDLLRHTDLVLFNPRQFDFRADNPYAAYDQITWEHRHLHRADRILFWFPHSETSVCPITLFELGSWLRSDKHISVGVEPGYVREVDVRVQTKLARPEITVVSTLEDLAREIR